MNSTVGRAAVWFSAAVVIAATASLVYTVATLGGRQADAREAAYQESYAASRPEGYRAGYDERYPAAYGSGYDDGYAEGDGRGYEEAYPLGLHEGRTEGYDSGYSVGLDERQTEGYEATYEDGRIAGRQRGYEGAFPAGLEDGREDGLATRVDLRNPTWWDMRGFLANDSSNATTYDLDFNNCVDYAIKVVNNAEAQGIRAGIVLLTYVTPPGHAIVVFDTTDRGLKFVEPQTDQTVRPVIGRRWRDSLTLPPGYYWPPSPPDDVIVSIEIIW